jgi:hypothetical protein
MTGAPMINNTIKIPRIIKRDITKRSFFSFSVNGPGPPEAVYKVMGCA